MRPRLLPFAPFVLTLALGCSEGGADDSGPDFPDLAMKVPVSGVIRSEGRPLAKAVVTFLPARGGTGVGETGEDGRYELASYGTPGLIPGEYKVAVSYLVSAEGEPQGMEARSSFTKPPGMATATERLSPEVSDLGRTKLKATVGPKGGEFVFDVKAPSGLPEGARPAAPEAEAKAQDKEAPKPNSPSP